MTEPAPQRPVDLHRAYELEIVSEWIPRASRVLDVGAGSGFQAATLAAKGHDVTAVDIAGRTPLPVRYFDVRDYDGTRLPFSDHAFDVVLTSHVLAHARDVRTLLSEMRRVVREDGHVVHIVPTAMSRIWAIGLFYPVNVRRLAAVARRKVAGVSSTAASARYPLRTRIINTIFPPPLGRARTSLHELFSFMTSRWKRLLEDSGFDVLAVRRTGLFSTGYFLAGSMSIERRRRLAPFLGNASVAFLTKPAAQRVNASTE
jgi:SAM-dependent methyltransferase